MPLIRGDDGVYHKEKHINGRRPPSPYTANSSRYASLNKQKAPRKTNWSLIKFAIMVSPLLLGLYVLFFRT